MQISHETIYQYIYVQAKGDLIIGKDHKSAIGALVERSTRYAIIVKLKSKDA